MTTQATVTPACPPALLRWQVEGRNNTLHIQHGRSVVYVAANEGLLCTSGVVAVLVLDAHSTYPKAHIPNRYTHTRLMTRRFQRVIILSAVISMTYHYNHVYCPSLLPNFFLFFFYLLLYKASPPLLYIHTFKSYYSLCLNRFSGVPY